MNQRIGGLVAAIGAVVALVFLASLAVSGPASGQTIPATWTPGNELTATAQAATSATATGTPAFVCINGTPFPTGGTIPAPGVTCLDGTATSTSTSTATQTGTSTSTRTPTPTATATPVSFHPFGLTTNGTQFLIYYTIQSCVDAANYEIDFDFGDGSPHAILSPIEGGCPGPGGSFGMAVARPNYAPGVYDTVATLRQKANPARVLEVRVLSQYIQGTAVPTTTRTSTATITPTSTPFVVTDRTFMGRIQR